VHVHASDADPQSLEIHFFDETGLDLAPAAEKKVERLYFRGEFRRAFFDEVGDVTYPPRALEYYSAGLMDALARQGFGDTWSKVVADLAGGAAAIVFPQVAAGWHINLIGMNALNDAEATVPVIEDPGEGFETLVHSMELFQADLGVRFDSEAERIRLVTPRGRVLDGDTGLHTLAALWCAADKTGRPIAVPLQASSAVEDIAARTGHTVLRPGRSRRSLAQAARDGKVGFAGSTTGGYIFSDFLAAYDAVLAVGMIAKILGALDRSLDQVVEELPPFFKREISVFCPIERKGAVMRVVTEAAASLDTDYTEGVRVRFEDGWVLVLPHGSEPLVSVYAEAQDEAKVGERAAQWEALVQSAIADG